jgi:hypothetical protein
MQCNPTVMTAHGLPLRILDMSQHDVVRARSLVQEGVSQQAEAELLRLAGEYVLTSAARGVAPREVSGELTAARPTEVRG